MCVCSFFLSILFFRSTRFFGDAQVLQTRLFGERDMKTDKPQVINIKKSLKKEKKIMELMQLT